MDIDLGAFDNIFGNASLFSSISYPKNHHAIISQWIQSYFSSQGVG